MIRFRNRGEKNGVLLWFIPSCLFSSEHIYKWPLTLTALDDIEIRSNPTTFADNHFYTYTRLKLRSPTTKITCTIALIRHKYF